jgi:ABC-type nickel/cobalt efflux system permease component RcnA
LNPALALGVVSFPLWTTLGLGFVLGLRHALDADHLAAVSTFVSEERSLFRASLIGVYWGVGHTAALLVFGFAIAAFRLTVSARLSQYLEFAVGSMLVFLGARVLIKMARGKPLQIHAHEHEHEGAPHAHPHFHGNSMGAAHRHHLRRGLRPFVVGVIHGLAGTGAVMLLVVSAIPSLLMAMGYILVFGVGCIGGMVVMSLLMSVPLALAASRLQMVERLVRLTAGLFSLGFGLWLAWDVGVIQAWLGKG